MKPLISVSDLLILSLTIVTVIIVLTKNHGDEGFDLYGSSGADTLTGDPGDNLIWGGAGADIIDGGDGLDTLDYGGSDAGVRVMPKVTWLKTQRLVAMPKVTALPISSIFREQHLTTF